MPETCIRFGELGARVMIEDKEVQHFNMQVDPAKKEVSCWIASEAGKAFSVVWLEFDTKFPSRGKLYLDGHPARTVRRLDAEPIIFRYITISESSRMPFQFSPLVVTDDDAYLDTSLSHSIGEIKLVVERTTVPVSAKHMYFATPHLQKVHERSKKAIAHRVNYGNEIPNPQKTTYFTSQPIETLVTFIFKYRPLDMLRANDIVPRIGNPVPRNPGPLEHQKHALDARATSETSSGKGEHFKVKKGHESGSEDEYSMREKALLAEAERIRTEVEKLRKERQLKDSELERPKKRLKKEDNLKPLFIPGEIIDLT